MTFIHKKTLEYEELKEILSKIQVDGVCHDVWLSYCIINHVPKDGMVFIPISQTQNGETIVKTTFYTLAGFQFKNSTIENCSFNGFIQ